MFRGRELKSLELRRRELVLQSTINRLTMKEELQHLQTAFHPAERIVGSLRAVRPWLLLLAPLAGIFAARSVRGNGSGFSKLMSLLKLLRTLLALWKEFGAAFMAPSTNAEPETPPATTVPEARA
jgi:hypothetical protein